MTVTDRLSRLPTWQISQVAVRSHRLLHEHLARVGESGYGYRVLAALGDLGHVSQAELGRAAALDRHDVTHTIRELQARRLVTRRANPQDSRQSLVALTSAGRSRLARLDKTIEEIQEEVLAPLSARQRETLITLLQRLL